MIRMDYSQIKRETKIFFKGTSLHESYSDYILEMIDKAYEAQEYINNQPNKE